MSDDANLTLEQKIQRYQRKRNQYAPAIALPILKTGFLVSLLLVLATLVFIPILTIFFGIIALFWFIGWVWLESTFADLEYRFRKSVLPEAVKRVRTNATYRLASRLRIEDLKVTRLFDAKLTRGNFKDEIRGSHGGVNWELHHYAVFSPSKFEKEADKKSETGLLVVIENRSPINGAVKIELDLTGELIRSTLSDSLHQSTKSSGLELIRLENPNFEDHFVVTASDPIEARIVMTPKMMENFTQIRSAIAAKFRCSFLSDGLYFVFPGQRLDVSINGKIDLPSISKILEEEISRAETIIEKLFPPA